MHLQKNSQANVLPIKKKLIDKVAPCESITHFNWFSRFEDNEYRQTKNHALCGLALVENK